MTSLSKKIYSQKKIDNAEKANEILKKMVLDYNREHFIVLHLNARNIATSAHIISIGTLNSTLVHPREVFFKAVREKSTYLIVAHNHPSGETEPSEADILLTERLKKAGELMGIEIMDHLIMDKQGNYKSIIN